MILSLFIFKGEKKSADGFCLCPLDVTLSKSGANTWACRPSCRGEKVLYSQIFPKMCIAAGADNCSGVCCFSVVLLSSPESASLPSPSPLSAELLLSLLVPGQGWAGGGGRDLLCVHTHRCFVLVC